MFMAQLVTLGETMAAFAPDRMGPLRYVSNYGIRIAGAESNTAIGAAKLGVQAAWVSRLGADEFGQYIRKKLWKDRDYTPMLRWTQGHSFC